MDSNKSMEDQVEKKEQLIDNFDAMNLKENLLRGVYSYGFERPSLIQSKAIPIITQRRDLIAQSHSGTGKTGAFTISTLQNLDDKVNGCQALIIAHTKELAQQISDVCSNIGQYLPVKTVLCIGGQDINVTRTELNSPNPIVVIGTPGRVIDLIKRRYLSTRLLRILVVDEADEMFSRSFQEQMRNIINVIPQNAQICLFSATVTDQMLALTGKFMRDPESILIEKEHLTLDGIRQFYVNVETDLWKFETFCDLYDIISVSQTIVYVNSIKRGDELKYQLEEKKFTVSLIHSGMTVPERNVIMKDFRMGKTRILISTDLLSRGIDIQQISVVINYDLPRDKECYIHRIGRSGRFGRKGIAINLVSRNEERTLYELKNYYKTVIDPMPNNIQQFLS
ncbi:ATP-dependent RNA helicase DEAD-box [Fadolivirus algeromassiliense]|jgi:translation initiation factor 4A|uniref:RNA helicase n=1 Tax=Fadolivirus FV1/VV64 TaxID=3070911 RepID=A0A7D3QTX7_9VIRU|nr:ATP-dependent RNA helicase DEAD-box [Fadolivirus algeromassiliense]QKF93683.1 ATP-dependent RNA helicase DEAD-box [Fadolivirus FV1/VV64]